MKMQKLTKEQAQWLKERIKDLYFNNYPVSNDAHNYSLDVKDIINQCTEKEFPLSEIQFDPDSKIYFEYEPCDEQPGIRMHLDVYGGDESQFKFWFNEFKDFAQGVNEIVKWIDEQEKE